MLKITTLKISIKKENGGKTYLRVKLFDHSLSKMNFDKFSRLKNKTKLPIIKKEKPPLWLSQELKSN